MEEAKEILRKIGTGNLDAYEKGLRSTMAACGFACEKTTKSAEIFSELKKLIQQPEGDRRPGPLDALWSDHHEL